MSGSFSTTATFTITDARYVGAKIGADLRLLHAYYGCPSVARIGEYAEEAALLLRDGHLRAVDYGFKTGDAWTLRLRYTATIGGLLADDRPGQLPSAAALAGSSFYSFLTYSPAFHALPADRRAAVEAALPITRGHADEPTARAGATTAGHGYGRNGAGVARDVYTAS